MKAAPLRVAVLGMTKPALGKTIVVDLMGGAGIAEIPSAMHSVSAGDTAHSGAHGLLPLGSDVCCA